MQIIEIKKLDNGGHRNQTWEDSIPLPIGYAVIPDALDTPNFPFGDIAVESIDGIATVTEWTPLQPQGKDDESHESQNNTVSIDELALSYLNGVQNA